MNKTKSLISLIFILSIFGCSENSQPVAQVEPPLQEDKVVEERKLPIELNDEERAAIAEEQDNDSSPKIVDVQQKTLEQLKQESAKLKRNLAKKHVINKSGSHFIVVGSFKTSEFQSKMETKIKREKLSFKIVRRKIRGQELNTIKIGPINSDEEADTLLNHLKNNGFPQDSFIE